MTLSESTAILIYLAEKTGRFLPTGGAPRYETMQWLMFQTAGIGPICGQGQVFGRFLPELNAGAVAHFGAEAARLYDVLDARLATHEHLAGNYSIADIATWPWVARHDWYGVSLSDYPNVVAWFDRIGARPAVQRGALVPGDDTLVAGQLKR